MAVGTRRKNWLRHLPARKGFAYGRSGRPVQHLQLLTSVLADVQLTYQNLDSVELGVTTVDTYFDTLGGINSAVRRAKGGALNFPSTSPTRPAAVAQCARCQSRWLLRLGPEL